MMTRPENILVFGDETWPVDSLVKSLPSDSKISVWIEGRGWMLPARVMKSASSHKLSGGLEGLKDKDPAVAIVGLSNAARTQELVGELLSQRHDLRILQLKPDDELMSEEDEGSGKHGINWRNLAQGGVEQELYMITLRARVEELRKLVGRSGNVALLLQNEPDPDGISSALALRKLLHRHATSTPIVSFGKVTRPENKAMIKLLDIQLEQVKEKDLANFDKVICLDCQPSFFKSKKLPAITAILDHHPRCEEGLKGVPFVEVRADLGSAATMMTEFLMAEKIEPSQRLATALLYGIKSDTLSLHRQVSFGDVEAFLNLYSRANLGLVKRMEKPQLPLEYIRSLEKGFAYLKVKNSIAVLPLVNVDREEWIAQAADFLMQIESAKWALVAGILGNELIISGRNCGYIHHCGDVFKKLFDYLGSAGGHRSLARAVISRKRWVEVFGAGSDRPKELSSLLHRILYKEISNY
jgi:nanoRNase/pAp phosphatase (c-di-AMP/oligoRNAs hydrolase)